MGKKKGGQKSQHVQQSMGQMVSQAALAQMGPKIDRFVRAIVANAAEQIKMETASTLETMFSRIVVLENIIMEKHGYTVEDLATKVATIEDEKENLKLVDGPVEKGDVVRIEVSTKTKDQTEFQGTSRLRIYKTGTGETLGEEMESVILGMKSGETKTAEFGKDKQMVVRVTLNRVSRGEKAPETTPEVAAETPAEETKDASQSQG